MNGTRTPRKHLVAAASMAALLALAGCGDKQDTSTQAALGEQQVERPVDSALPQSGSAPAGVEVAANANPVDNELGVQGSTDASAPGQQESAETRMMGVGPADGSAAGVESGSFADPAPRADRG